jgi:hypothetical protein
MSGEPRKIGCPRSGISDLGSECALQDWARCIFSLMKRCLYCTETPDSEEHPLSAALGEFNGAPTLLNRICEQCNNRRIGLLDEQFIRCGPAAILRKRFGIEGREHHQKVNPFYRGSAGGQRIKYLAWDEAFGCEVLVELTGGEQGRQLSQLILKGQDGPHHHIPLTRQRRLTRCGNE